MSRWSGTDPDLQAAQGLAGFVWRYAKGMLCSTGRIVNEGICLVGGVMSARVMQSR